MGRTLKQLVLDTSALLFWTLDPTRLSRVAERRIAAADRLLLSSISVWEVGIKVAKGRLDLPLPVRQWTHELLRVEGLRVIPVDHEVWLTNLELTWTHADPADRTIVATASLFACPLVTSDQRMHEFYGDCVW